LQETHATSELILDSLSQPVLFLDAQFRVRKTNQAFCRTFQVQGAEIKDKSFFDLCDGAWDTPLLKALFDGVVPNHQQITDYQVEAEFPHVGKKTMTVSARRVQRDGAVNILVILDLT
jgi:nitrogen-specific signal transduction histidine kinase